MNPNDTQTNVSAPFPEQLKVIAPNPKTKKFKTALMVCLVLDLLLLVGLGYFALQQQARVTKAERDFVQIEQKLKESEAEVEKRKNTTGEENINPKAYQAVFLKSGQVYFGKITKISESQITLESIYYLRTGDSKTPTNLDEINKSTNISLVKLGEELHGPEDKMFIERDQLEFWENLKSEGQVAKAITAYEGTKP